jgi:hypothetical protein
MLGRITCAMRFRPNVVEVLLMVVQGFDVVGVRSADRVVKMGGGGEAAKHPRNWRRIREVVRAGLSVLARAA